VSGSESSERDKRFIADKKISNADIKKFLEREAMGDRIK